MWRSFFLAGGIFLILLGGQTLVLENVSLTKFKLPKNNLDQALNNQPANGYGTAYQPSRYAFAGFSNNQNGNSPQPGDERKRVFNMKDWMPWSLLAAGAIIVLYTHSLPRQRGYERDD